MPTNPTTERTGWTSGERVDTRFARLDGSTSGVHPMTVVSDDGTLLLATVPVGTPIQRGVLVDGRDIRDADLAQRFRLPRKLIRSTWSGTSTLRLIDEDHWSSVWWFFDGVDGSFRGWYVNLEIPLGRAASAVLRCDGVLDVWVGPVEGRGRVRSGAGGGSVRRRPRGAAAGGRTEGRGPGRVRDVPVRRLVHGFPVLTYR